VQDCCAGERCAQEPAARALKRKSAAREKLQWACGYLAKAKAKAKAKARVNVLVEAPWHSKPSTEARLCQTDHGKRGGNAHGE
jgi:hypothetical protein